MSISKRKKTINYILFFLFLSFAVVQLNDADGLLWFFIYLIVSGICLLSTFRTIPKSILRILIGALCVYAAFHFSLFIDFLQTDQKEEFFGEMVYDKPYLEGSREFLGLIIAIIAVWFQFNKKT